MRDAPGRGVSPVVGVVLLVAIVVVLAALVGSVATSMGDSLNEPAPKIYFDISYDPAGDGNGGKAYLTFTHESGEIADGAAVYVEDGDGDRVAWEDVWTGSGTIETGGYAHIDGIGSDCALTYPSVGEVYQVVWEGPEGSRHVLKEYEIEESPAQSHSDVC